MNYERIYENEDKLIPCPHCGGKAEYFINKHENSDTTHLHKIRCIDIFGCGAEMSDCISYYGNYELSVQKFIDKWNRRKI